MYDRWEIREFQRLEFEARIHGVLKDDNVAPVGKTESSSPQKPFLFGDPKDYKKMSPEEREKMTKKMMTFHKAWAGRSEIGEDRNHAN